MKFNNQMGIRIISDELADRGSNDYFTLKIFEKLHNNQVPFEIQLSNHGIEFIDAYETEHYIANNRYLAAKYIRSLRGLAFFIQAGLVEREEIIKIVRQTYQPHLKLIGYSFDQTNNSIIIYSHAGIGLKNIEALAEQFDVEYQDKNAEELANTLNEINATFQCYVQADSVNILYDKKNYDIKKNPLLFSIWNRKYKDLDRHQTHNNYTLKFVHGHDSREITKDHIYNLDNELGKSTGFRSAVGNYEVLWSSENKISLVKDSETTLQFNNKRELLKQLTLIGNKARQFKNDGYKNDSIIAMELYHNLLQTYKKFFLYNEMDLKSYKELSQDAITKARPVLDAHRGCKQILGNIVIALMTLCTCYIYTKGKLILFKTDSHKILDKFARNLNDLSDDQNKLNMDH